MKDPMFVGEGRLRLRGVCLIIGSIGGLLLVPEGAFCYEIGKYLSLNDFPSLEFYPIFT